MFEQYFQKTEFYLDLQFQISIKKQSNLFYQEIVVIPHVKNTIDNSKSNSMKIISIDIIFLILDECRSNE